MFSSVLSCRFIYPTGKEEENTNRYLHEGEVDTEPGNLEGETTPFHKIVARACDTLTSLMEQR